MLLKYRYPNKGFHYLDIMSFSRGANTLQVTAELFIENRCRLVAALQKVSSKGSVIVLEGGKEKNRYNTDAEDLPFRQVKKNFFFNFCLLLKD